jgi:hypothetical protein
MKFKRTYITSCEWLLRTKTSGTECTYICLERDDIVHRNGRELRILRVCIAQDTILEDEELVSPLLFLVEFHTNPSIFSITVLPGRVGYVAIL